jgi:hypothetical protein
MLFSSCNEVSLYPASRCRVTMELSPHSNDIRVRLVDMSVPWQTTSPIVKDVFLTELVIRDLRNWGFFHPLIQLIESLRLDISWCCWDSELFRGRLIAKTHLFLKRILICRSSELLQMRLPPPLSFQRHLLERHLLQSQNFWKSWSTLHVTTGSPCVWIFFFLLDGGHCAPLRPTWEKRGENLDYQW